MIKDLKISKGTIVRTTLTIIVVVNLILKACGMNVISVDEESVTSLVENLASAGAIVWGFWKNNSFTMAAKSADFALAKYKNFDGEADEVDDSEGE